MPSAVWVPLTERMAASIGKAQASGIEGLRFADVAREIELRTKPLPPACATVVFPARRPWLVLVSSDCKLFPSARWEVARALGAALLLEDDATPTLGDAWRDPRVLGFAASLLAPPNALRAALLARRPVEDTLGLPREAVIATLRLARDAGFFGPRPARLFSKSEKKRLPSF